MKKLLLLPTLMFPYTVCLIIGYGLIAQNFSNLIITILGIIALVTLLNAFVCNSLYIIFTKEKNAYELLKTAILIKIVHIPTYILIFILGFFMGLMFFMTFPIIILLVAVDLITLWMSGMISVYSVAKALKQGGLCPKPLLIIAMVCQFFFCADIISLFVINFLAKKNNKISVKE